jgi:hypothetical protein
MQTSAPFRCPYAWVLWPDLALHRWFVNELHHPAFSEATLSRIVTRGGPNTFDFQGHVMVFVSKRQPAFSVSFADCVPTGVFALEVPDMKDILRAMEDKYNSVANFDKATMEHFAGLIMDAPISRMFPFATIPLVTLQTVLVGSQSWNSLLTMG